MVLLYLPACYLSSRQLSLLRGQRFPALPNHKGGDAQIDGDRNDAHNQVNVACAFQHLNQLRAHFRSSNCSNGHDQSKAKIDIAEGPMPFCCNHRLADDVCQIGADGEAPIKTHCAQRRARDETAAHSKEAAEDADEKTDDDKINWADVRSGDWKKHGLFRAAA